MATYGQGVSILSSAWNHATGAAVHSLVTVPAGCYAELMIHELSAAATFEFFVAGVLTGTLSGVAAGASRYIIGAGVEVRKTVGTVNLSWSYTIFKNT